MTKDVNTGFDFEAYTNHVIASIGPKAHPRTKEVFPIVIRKLHELIVEADLSIDEILAACELIISAGHASNDKRNEMLLVLDTFGVESLVDVLDTTRAVRKGEKEENPNASASAILGPFYRTGVPEQPNGTTIVRCDEPDALGYTHLHGVVYDEHGKPLPNATVDVWHDAPDGLYDAQTPHKPEYHCRGRFRTDENGRYELVCLKPTPYPIPNDEAAGALLKMMDRHPYRPAHIHFWIQEPNHQKFVTQVFNSDSDYLKDDAVFAVKDQLVVDYKPVPEGYKGPKGYDGPKIDFELELDFHLQGKA